MDELWRDLRALHENVSQVYLGKPEVVNLLLAALISRGHVLLEDKPGLGKTILARSLAQSVNCTFKRIQCTPDLLPIDITGYVDPRSNEFKRGPIFANIVLADELNRATPRTQSALLEAMAEGQVTVEGCTYPLPEVFMVIATQNPVEYRGVNDLPEAQLDRFQMLLSPGYPSLEDEERILEARQVEDPLSKIQPVVDVPCLRKMMSQADRVRIEPALVQYLLEIVAATRRSKHLLLGVSPRGALQFMRLVKAFAFSQQRDYVVPDDIKQLAPACLAHRIMPRTTAEGSLGGRRRHVKIIEALVAKTELVGPTDVKRLNATAGAV